jgi:hypothetical protein
VQQIRAFSAGRPTWSDAATALGAEHPATVALRECLVHVSQGCHRFHARDKLAAYVAAREQASRSAALLLLEGKDDAARISERVEQELLPAITGLIRRAERREQR